MTAIITLCQTHHGFRTLKPFVFEISWLLYISQMLRVVKKHCFCNPSNFWLHLDIRVSKLIPVSSWPNGGLVSSKKVIRPNSMGDPPKIDHTHFSYFTPVDFCISASEGRRNYSDTEKCSQWPHLYKSYEATYVLKCLFFSLKSQKTDFFVASGGKSVFCDFIEK